MRVEGAKGDFFTVPPMELLSYLSGKPELVTLRGVGDFVMEEKPAILNRIARFLKA